ncbi:MAG: hypothetical protein ACJ0DJ_10690 [bacterium]
MNYTFPFTAIVGLELVKRSLIYHAIDPRLGGILLMGHRGLLCKEHFGTCLSGDFTCS